MSGFNNAIRLSFKLYLHLVKGHNGLWNKARSFRFNQPCHHCPDMFLHPENKQATLLDMQTARSVAAKREFLISLIRLGTSANDPHIWAAVHTLVSSAVVPMMLVGFLPVMMRVGFLPVIPKPITERATVRHCLTNFQSVRRQLNQESMAIWCDEGVFARPSSRHTWKRQKSSRICSSAWGFSIGLAFYSGARASCFEVLGQMTP